MGAMTRQLVPPLVAATAAGRAPDSGGNTVRLGAGLAVSAPASAAGATSGACQIMLEITGREVKQATSITYGVGGSTSQGNGAARSLQKVATSKGAVLLLSLVAQSVNGTNGAIPCMITARGAVIMQSGRQGQRAMVACSRNA